MTIFINFLKNYVLLLRASKFSPEIYRDRQFGLLQNLVNGNPNLLKESEERQVEHEMAKL